jgi:hypothetical protein
MKRADQRKYHYIYKITRIDGSGKYYFGMHSTDDLDDGYFGSGTRLWKSIRKHGKDKHSKEILEFLPSRDALKAREKELVTEQMLDDELCMNIVPGGHGNSPRAHWKTEPMWEVISAKLKDHWADPTVREAASRRAIAQWSNPEAREVQSQLKHQQYESQELLDKISAASTVAWACPELREAQRQMLMMKWQDPEYRAKNLKSQAELKKTPAFIEAQRAAKLGNKNPHYGTMWVHNDNLQRSMRVRKSEPIQDGWQPGRRMYNQSCSNT